MADQQNMIAITGMTMRLDMHFRDQRAGRVDGDHIAALRFRHHGFCHPMGGKDHRRVIGNFIEFVDKNRAFRGQPINDKFIMDNFMTDINRRAKFFERHFNNLNRAINTGAEPARSRQSNRFGLSRGWRCLMRFDHALFCLKFWLWST